MSSSATCMASTDQTLVLSTNIHIITLFSLLCFPPPLTMTHFSPWPKAATPPRGDDVQGCPNTTRPCRLSGSTPWALSRGWEENAAGCDGTGWAGLPCEAPATPPRHINRTLLQHRHTWWKWWSAVMSYETNPTLLVCLGSSVKGQSGNERELQKWKRKYLQRITKLHNDIGTHTSSKKNKVQLQSENVNANIVFVQSTHLMHTCVSYESML